MIYQGLSHTEAQKIYLEKGPNEIPKSKKFSFLYSIFEALSEPMSLILLLACVVYIFIGRILDFGILLFSALVIITINIYQNFKSEQTLEKLQSFTKKICEVFRDGQKVQIESKYLVEGDYVIVNEGDRIPADILILEFSNLLIDEAILTGESSPVRKKTIKDLNLKEFKSDYIAYSGTLITSGWLVGVVYKTGKNSKIGILGTSLELIKDEEPQVKKEINQIVFNLAILCIVTCLFVFGYNYYQTSDISSSVIYAISLAIALVPEELPIVLAIFLALSSLRLSNKGLIIKNKAIMETLGAANIICVDKTGTITKNNQKLQKIIYENNELDFSNLELSNEVKKILTAAYLSKYFNSKDSIDTEIEEIFKKTGIDVSEYETKEEGVLDRKFVYSKKYLLKKDTFVFAKGAYEEISKICRINSKYEDFILDKLQELTNVGYRVIAVAQLKSEKEETSKKFELLGLLAFHDELREESAEYIKICQENSIRVCMVTGDHKNTAIYYAKIIGLNNFENVLNGDQLEKLPDSKLKELIPNTNVFARIEPHQKLKLVNFLKSGNNIVAMTGDGVNDSLALKSANIGISIGEGGTDIARETSDVILIQNNLKSIIEGIKEGRRIYFNLGITARYIYSFHLPIILISIFNTFFQLPFLLTPIHIAFLEFIIDPFSTVVFESIPAQANILALKPRKSKFQLIDNMRIGLGSVYGFSMFLMIFIPYYLINTFDPESAKTVAILNLLLLNILLIYFNYSEKLTFIQALKNKTFAIAISILTIISGLVFYFRNNLTALGLGGSISEAEYLILLSSVGIFIFIGFFTKKFSRV